MTSSLYLVPGVRRHQPYYRPYRTRTRSRLRTKVNHWDFRWYAKRSLFKASRLVRRARVPWADNHSREWSSPKVGGLEQFMDVLLRLLRGVGCRIVKAKSLPTTAPFSLALAVCPSGIVVKSGAEVSVDDLSHEYGHWLASRLYRPEIEPHGYYDFNAQVEEELAFRIQLSVLSQICGMWTQEVIDCADYMSIEADDLPRAVAEGDVLRSFVEPRIIADRKRKRMIKLTAAEAGRISPEDVVIISRAWKGKTKDAVRPFKPGGGAPKYRVTVVKVAKRLEDGTVMAEEFNSGSPVWSHYVSDRSEIGEAAADLLRWLNKLGWDTSYTSSSRDRAMRKKAQEGQGDAG